MVGPLDPAPPATNDRAESEAEAANRQNLEADRQKSPPEVNSGHGEPGGEATHVTGGTGPTGEPQASTRPGGMASEGEPDSSAGRDGGAEKGMLGEGV